MRHLTKCMLGVAAIGAIAMIDSGVQAQNADPNSAPQTYREDPGWAKLTNGRKWGAVSAVDIDRDGKSVWIFDRCETADDCSKSKLDPVMKFDSTGKMVKSFGGGMVN